MLRVKASAGNEDIATVYIAETAEGDLLEFVESVQPPLPRDQKWVLIISTLHGCPVSCRFCDAGKSYSGKVSAEGMLAQIDYMVRKRYPGLKIPAEKFKVQFARMGEPAFNLDVLEVLEALPALYHAPGLIPAISTIAPVGAEEFFEGLLDIKKRIYPLRFQLQFSIHTTDTKKRDWLIPLKKWSFSRIAEYGDRFFDSGGRKITLNFALADGMPVDPDVLLKHFSPDRFLLKITPVNPTCEAERNRVNSHIVSGREKYSVIEKLENAGYDVILSIGEPEENHIGSNCGQFIHSFLENPGKFEAGYNYELKEI